MSALEPFAKPMNVAHCERRQTVMSAVVAAAVGLASAAVMFKLGSRKFSLRQAYNALIEHNGDHTQTKSYPFDLLYNRTVISLNYLDHGFVRRGLGGTIAHLLSRDVVDSGLLFHMFSMIILIVPIAAIITLTVRNRSFLLSCYLAIVIAFSPQTFAAWGVDIARTDVLVAGLLAWAALATIGGFRLSAVVIVAVGYLVHETSVIFGLPLLIALNIPAYGSGRLSERSAVRLGAGFVVLMACLVIAQIAFSPPAAVIRADMLTASPVVTKPEDVLVRDIAIFVASSGARGLKDSQYYNFVFNRQFGIMACIGLAMLAGYIFILPLRQRPFLAIACVVVPFVFMLIVATDTGRWLKLAVLNAWLLASFLQITTTDPTPSRREMVVGGVLFAAFIAMGVTPFDWVSEGARRVSLLMGIPEPGTYEEWLNQCDPTWRDWVYDRHAANASAP